MSDLIKWEKIRYLVLDVDGTMTDGGVYLDSQGNEMKKFSIKDGAGILLLRQGGIAPVILTGRESLCVAKEPKNFRFLMYFRMSKGKKNFSVNFFENIR